MEGGSHPPGKETESYPDPVPKGRDPGSEMGHPERENGVAKRKCVFLLGVWEPKREAHLSGVERKRSRLSPQGSPPSPLIGKGSFTPRVEAGRKR